MVNLGKEAIFFGDSRCPACQAQVKILDDHYKKKGTAMEVMYCDLGKIKPPKQILDKDGSYATPTWYFPNNPLIKGVISPAQFEKNLKNGKRPWRFGENKTAAQLTFESIPQINSLVKYGKNFPNGKGFEINNSWTDVTKKIWGKDITNSGTLGREFGPKGVDKIYTDKYLNNIRMAVPGGDLETTLSLNRECNIVNKPESKTNSVGLIFDSKNQQIVPMNNFGRKKNKFGNLYNQMGPAFERGNQYLVDPLTVTNLYGGATQNEPPRPGKVNNPLSYIGQAKEYKPLEYYPSLNKPTNFKNKRVSKIGTKTSKKNKIGEGSVLTVKNNKIKVSNTKK
jgi:hypothetical protein